MRLLVLGGTGFVGRTIVEEARTQGHQITVLNRGQRPPVTGVTALTGDRTTTQGLAALGAGTWDLVVDTWSAAPHAVRDAARTLQGRAGHYTYISSRSVYADGSPTRITEDSPVVDGSPDSDDTSDYAAAKRGGELAAAQFGPAVLLARAGLILGPHEDIGRLPWWLYRLARGGPTLAPGPRDLALQYIDARDLARFVLDAAAGGLTGPYNVTSESGHTTMGELLDLAVTATGNHAELRWADPETILAAGIQPWTELPIWLPPDSPDYDFIHDCDVSKAMGAGLQLRSVRDTVVDTWAWLQTLPGTATIRPDRPSVGLDPAVEAKVLANLS
jgi:nucleoside-diphosphate-sugar epimerase